MRMGFSSLVAKLVRTWITSFLCCAAIAASGQDLEPRVLSMVPIKANFAVASYSYSHGNYLLDENIIIKDLKANLHSFIAGYARSFKLINRSAKFDAVLPYSLGKWSAIVSNADTSVNRGGFGDPMVRISMILVGGPALSLAEFAAHDPSRFRLGVFFRMRMPFGTYNKHNVINFGANRWAFKTGIGASYRLKKFIFEGYINAWWFTDNKEYLVDNVVSQAAIMTFQGHVIYTMKKGKWLAISIGQSGFGETSLNGVPQENRQNTWKYGIAFSLPVKHNQALKVVYTSGLVTRFGADFKTVALLYQFMWFDKVK